MSMTIKRREALLSNMQTSLKKVFDCVPMQEAWNANQITHELNRKKQSIGSTSMIGCLNNLKKAKLITEHKPGYFKQIECKKMTVKPKNIAMPEPAEDPLQGLRDAIEKVSDIKSELEITLMEVEEYVAGFDDKLEKLNQLKSLLKSIGN